jgi:hypothetical protein
LVYCTLVSNPSTYPTNLIFSYTPQNVNFGAVAQYAPPVIGFNKITSGSFQNFTITIKDRNFNAVSFQDPQTTIILYIKDEGIDF